VRVLLLPTQHPLRCMHARNPTPNNNNNNNNNNRLNACDSLLLVGRLRIHAQFVALAFARHAVLGIVMSACC